MKREVLKAIATIPQRPCDDDNNYDNVLENPLPTNPDDDGKIMIIDGMSIDFDSYRHTIEACSMGIRVGRLVDAMWPDEGIRSRLCFDTKRIINAVAITPADVDNIKKCCERLQTKTRLWRDTSKKPKPICDKRKLVRGWISSHLKNSRYRHRPHDTDNEATAGANVTRRGNGNGVRGSNVNGASATRSSSTKRDYVDAHEPAEKMKKLAKLAKLNRAFTFNDIQERTGLSIQLLKLILTPDSCMKENDKVSFVDLEAEYDTMQLLTCAAAAGRIKSTEIDVEALREVAKDNLPAAVVDYLWRKYTIPTRGCQSSSKVRQLYSWNLEKIARLIMYHYLKREQREDERYDPFVVQCTEALRYCGTFNWNTFLESHGIVRDRDGIGIALTTEQLPPPSEFHPMMII